jgi:hypothetical protein
VPFSSCLGAFTDWFSHRQAAHHVFGVLERKRKDDSFYFYVISFITACHHMPPKLRVVA